MSQSTYLVSVPSVTLWSIQIALVFAFSAAAFSATTAAAQLMARGQFTGACGSSGVISAFPTEHPAAQDSYRSAMLPHSRPPFQRNLC